MLPGGQADPSYFRWWASMWQGLGVRIPIRGDVLGDIGGTLLNGGCGRTPQRRAELEAGSSATQLASGSQRCLICVDRTHSRRDRPGRLGRPVELGGSTGGVVAHGGE